MLVSDRPLMAADYSIMVIGDQPVADGPLVERSPDKGRRHRELRPAGANDYREAERIEDRVDRVAGQPDDEEGERPDVVAAAKSHRPDELANQDRLAVHPLLDLRIRAPDAKIDSGAAGPRHDCDGVLIQAVDPG